ncbi:DUF6894 family protein [Sphingomonas sp. 22176]|uniref:DUF6894 family protein n=1 Tax=Sphingomonas sp. 22176 TaxID=3453884 RepID=UPI003F84FAC8
MPRFLFHVVNDINVPDEEGRELTSLAMVDLVAIDAARELPATSVRQGKLNLKYRSMWKTKLVRSSSRYPSKMPLISRRK